MPLIIDVGNADIMATLLQLKADVEDKKGTRMKMVFSGAAEAHLLAAEIGEHPALWPRPILTPHASQREGGRDPAPGEAVPRRVGQPQNVRAATWVCVRGC